MCFYKYFIFFFVICFFFTCCSDSSPSLKSSYSSISSWSDKMENAEIHLRKKEQHLSAFKKTNNLVQLYHALNESSKALNIYYSIQSEYPRGSDFAYQTLLKRIEACKKHQKIENIAKANLIEPPPLNKNLCEFSF